MDLNSFFALVGLAEGLPPETVANFRSLGDAEAGVSADIERLTEGAGEQVVVSVWEWTKRGGHERVGRLVFDHVSGELRPGAEGDPVVLAGLIAGLNRMED